MTMLRRILSRLAALLLTIGVGAAALFWGVLPLLDQMTRLDERIEIAGETGQRLAMRIAREGDQRERLDGLRARIADSAAYLRAETEALATASIQQRLARLSEESGVRVLKVQDLPSQPSASGVRIALRADLSATTGELAALLYDLEADRPYLFVDGLQVRSRPQRGDQVTARVLAIQLELAGYLAPETIQ